MNIIIISKSLKDETLAIQLKQQFQLINNDNKVRIISLAEKSILKEIANLKNKNVTKLRQKITLQKQLVKLFVKLYPLKNYQHCICIGDIFTLVFSLIAKAHNIHFIASNTSLSHNHLFKNRFFYLSHFIKRCFVPNESSVKYCQNRGIRALYFGDYITKRSPLKTKKNNAIQISFFLDANRHTQDCFNYYLDTIEKLQLNKQFLNVSYHLYYGHQVWFSALIEIAQKQGWQASSYKQKMALIKDNFIMILQEGVDQKSHKSINICHIYQQCQMSLNAHHPCIFLSHFAKNIEFKALKKEKKLLNLWLQIPKDSSLEKLHTCILKSIILIQKNIAPPPFCEKPLKAIATHILDD